jgi:hypothetical protein
MDRASLGNCLPRRAPRWSDLRPFLRAVLRYHLWRMRTISIPKETSCSNTFWRSRSGGASLMVDLTVIGGFEGNFLGDFDDV